MTNHELQAILGANVVELTFVRRHKKAGWSDIRGLFGTTNFQLLNEEFGLTVLHFLHPKGIGMGYDYKSKNLCVVWDIFRQDYRVFGAEQVVIKKKWDVTTPEGRDAFIEYFETYIHTMSQQDKLDFMGFIKEEKILQTATVSPQTKAGIWNKLGAKFQPFINRVRSFWNRRKKK